MLHRESRRTAKACLATFHNVAVADLKLSCSLLRGMLQKKKLSGNEDAPTAEMKRNPKAFLNKSRNKAKLQRMRSAEKEQKRMHGVLHTSWKSALSSRKGRNWISRSATVSSHLEASSSAAVP